MYIKRERVLSGIAIRVRSRIAVMLLFFILGIYCKANAASTSHTQKAKEQELSEQEDTTSIEDKEVFLPASDEKNKNKNKKEDEKAEKESEVDFYKQVFTFVETMPSYPEGDAALISFIARSIRYPQSAAEAGQCGRVVCMFVVNEDGKISDIEVIRGICSSLNKEAIRVLKTMPKWLPGVKDGRKVKVRCSIPITFRLD